jgi:hypothetical protein
MGTFYLKQSVAVTLKIGKYIDNTDGYTAETGLTIAAASVYLSKNGGAFAAKNSTTACSHDRAGWYSCYLSATDTNTLGLLQLDATVSGALPVWHDYMVITANQYDTLFGTDYFDVNLAGNQSATIAAVTSVLDKTGYYLATDQSGVTFGKVNVNGDKTGYSLSSTGIDAFLDEPLSGHTTAGTLGLTIMDILRLLRNNRSIVSTTETCFADNGTDSLYQWTLNSATPPITSKTLVT